VAHSASSGSFRGAGRRLDVAPSTLSHIVTGLERKLGKRLFHRTTRSVRLTLEGEDLLARVAPLIAGLDEAVSRTGAEQAIAGTLRINAPLSAASHLLATVIPDFIARFPSVELDLRHEERMVDIVAEGCDAGIRLGRTVPGDMIGVPFGELLRFFPVASPGYLDQHGTPLHPLDLMNHRCIRTRLPRGERYAWEFRRNGEEQVIDVPGPLTLDRQTLMMEAAVAGMGIAFVLERAVASQIATGTLRPLLIDWCPADERYMLYYPGRRNVPPPLRAFIEYLLRGTA
jgi:DNA-binding transcriptional LysR family regulator